MLEQSYYAHSHDHWLKPFVKHFLFLRHSRPQNSSLLRMTEREVRSVGTGVENVSVLNKASLRMLAIKVIILSHKMKPVTEINGD